MSSEEQEQVPTWAVVLGIIAALLMLAAIPFACGACGGLVERGYRAVQP